MWDSHWITNNGDIHHELEKELKSYLNVNYINLFTNGHLALSLALRSLDLKGEVITTPFTFSSTTHAIVENGLTPVFCDIKRSDFTMDENKIEDLITDKTSAILPVHVYGHACNVKSIEQIAKKYNLKVIYDAAHAFGVKIKGTGIGNFGDVSMFSFHATKVFHTVEGGALVCNNENYSNLFDLVKNFGIISPERVIRTGTNAKLSEFHAAMGLVNLRYVDGLIEKRKILKEEYIRNLSDVQGIEFSEDQEGVSQNYGYLPILVDQQKYKLSRDQLFDVLKEQDIYPRKYFYPLTSDYDCYKNRFDSMYTPVAKYVANRILTLPLYSDLELEDVTRICEIIKNI
jgi:dTDP-4-amino-4,6-dideoxygalactose transaminase